MASLGQEKQVAVEVEHRVERETITGEVGVVIVVAAGEVDLVIDIGGEAEAVIDAAREVVKGGDVVLRRM